jgi:hypothetical protein
MLYLSEVLIQHHELQNFEELVELIKQQTQSSERFFSDGCAPTFS